LNTALFIVTVEQGAQPVLAAVPHAMERVQADDNGEEMDEDEVQAIL
jgi:hypothetical protein